MVTIIETFLKKVNTAELEEYVKNARIKHGESKSSLAEAIGDAYCLYRLHADSFDPAWLEAQIKVWNTEIEAHNETIKNDEDLTEEQLPGLHYMTT